MPKLLRSIAAAALAALSVLAFVPTVVQAGVGAGANITFPPAVTVGDTNLPASISMTNLNDSTESTFTNTVCNQGDAAPPCTPEEPSLSLLSDSGINAILSCSQFGTGTTCAPEGADPGVFRASATGTGADACAGITFDIAVVDPVYDMLRFTPQGGGNVELVGTGAVCTVDFTVDVLKMPADQDPNDPGIQTAQISDNSQYSGNLANDNRGTDDTTVSKATPQLTTTASADFVLGDGPLKDTASVTGQAFPDGDATVSFRLYGPGDTTCSAAPVFEDLDNPYPSTGGPLMSDEYTPTLAGEYRWVATFSGDSNNEQLVGTCGDPAETTVVSLASPTISTEASEAFALGDGRLSDTATLAGRASPIAGATVDFRLYGPDDATCANDPVFESLGVAQPIAEGPITSAEYTPSAPGTYQWVASYSGDANNNPAAGACGDALESTVVSQATPVLTTDAGDSIAIGTDLVDSATVTGRFEATATTIDFRLYGPNDATCANAPAFESLGVDYSAAGGPVLSEPFTPTAVGTYRWVATYNGDTNNATVVGTCGEASETVEVFKGLPTIVTTASLDIFLGAGSLTDTATVNGRVDPQAGATVDFRLYGPNDATCSGTPIFQTLDVAYTVAANEVTSAAFTPTIAGTYRWVASYSGDINNAPAEGFCGEASETVEVNPSPDVDIELPETGIGVRGALALGTASIMLGWLLLSLTTRRRGDQAA